jgi:hypothetical protein
VAGFTTSRSATSRGARDPLGRILRIDPRGAQPYAVPHHHPFFAEEGARSEIVAYGLRNPWRFWIDTPTRTMAKMIIGPPLCHAGARPGCVPHVEALELQAAEDLSAVFKALSDPTRVAIVSRLASGEQCCVSRRQRRGR